MDTASRKVEKYKELSKQQQMEIIELKQKRDSEKEHKEAAEMKLGALKHQLNKAESPEERDKLIRDLRRKNVILTDEIETIKKTMPSDTESLPAGKIGTLRTPRKTDTDLVLSKVTSSEVKLMQKLVKEEDGGEVWLLLEVLTTDLGKD